MANVSISMSDELKAKMAKFPSVNWSSVGREAMAQKIKEMEFLLEFKSKSTLTEEDALRLGAEVNAGLARRLQEYLSKHPGQTKARGKR